VWMKTTMESTVATVTKQSVMNVQMQITPRDVMKQQRFDTGQHVSEIPVAVMHKLLAVNATVLASEVARPR